ncbi:MAG: sugar ABC transporter ATP-binding protein [Gemmatimonadota bacterium]|nr:sugar ABC transporter ATP-binding protein [Gemmatimonadota bacterium]MDH5198004.1 sugar ABC transporter ATP-binding protein [Gemmatimonadota bacterium]
MLALEHITKRYPGVTALDSVDLALAPGRVHGLVGENGAGKSTLLRVLAGAAAPDEGRILLDGTPMRFRTPRHALEAGITVIYQELTLIPELGADANLFLGMEPGRRGLLDRAGMRRAAAETLARLGLELPDPGVPVRSLSVAKQQLVELGRALVREARVIALDEPTATLTPAEVAHLFAQVRALRDAGSAIVFVSHRLDEIRAIVDDLTVLRDGQAVWTGRADAVDDAAIIRLMVGRDVEYLRQPAGRPPDPEPLLVVDGLTRVPTFRDVCFTLHAGEIVALAGLVGAGRTEVARCLSGADRPSAGRVTLDGRDYTPTSPRAAVARGVVYLPEDRKRHGLVLGLRVRENVTLPVLERWTRGGVVRREAERLAALDATTRIQLRPPDIERATRTLSGGNQQKVVLARALLADARVLIADEPTRGVDVGAKAEIHRRIRLLADEGRAVLLISSELPEVLALADRIVVMREGRVTGTLTADAATPEAIMTLAVAA